MLCEQPLSLIISLYKCLYYKYLILKYILSIWLIHVYVYIYIYLINVQAVRFLKIKHALWTEFFHKLFVYIFIPKLMIFSWDLCTVFNWFLLRFSMCSLLWIQYLKKGERQRFSLSYENTSVRQLFAAIKREFTNS